MKAAKLKRRDRIELVTANPTAIHMRVEPVGDKWVWRVWLVYDGRPNPMTLPLKGGGPFESSGVERDQERADQMARLVADDARERYAAAQFDAMRRKSGGHSERLTL
jgi:hypothetical protein